MIVFRKKQSKLKRSLVLLLIYAGILGLVPLIARYITSLELAIKLGLIVSGFILLISNIAIAKKQAANRCNSNSHKNSRVKNNLNSSNEFNKVLPVSSLKCSGKIKKKFMQEKKDEVSSEQKNKKAKCRLSKDAVAVIFLSIEMCLQENNIEMAKTYLESIYREAESPEESKKAYDMLTELLAKEQSEDRLDGLSPLPEEQDKSKKRHEVISIADYIKAK